MHPGLCLHQRQTCLESHACAKTMTEIWFWIAKNLSAHKSCFWELLEPSSPPSWKTSSWAKLAWFCYWRAIMWQSFSTLFGKEKRAEKAVLWIDFICCLSQFQETSGLRKGIYTVSFRAWSCINHGNAFIVNFRFLNLFLRWVQYLAILFHFFFPSS